MAWSLILPGIAVHFNGLRVMGKSRLCAGNALHYQGRRFVGKSVRNSFGQPNHYHRNGKPVGYTRKIRRTKDIHFDGKYGRSIGWSRCLLIVWFHKFKNGEFFYS